MDDDVVFYYYYDSVTLRQQRSLTAVCLRFNTPAAWYWLRLVLVDVRRQDWTSPLIQGVPGRSTRYIIALFNLVRVARDLFKFYPSCLNSYLCWKLLFNDRVTCFNEVFLPRDAMLARYMPSPCVCLSVCLSHSDIVSKRLNIGLRKYFRTMAQEL